MTPPLCKHWIPLWMVLSALPFVGRYVWVGIWLLVYDDVRNLRPESRRVMFPDIMYCLVSLGLFAIPLPGLLMTDIRVGARRAGVSVPNYLPWYYIAFFVSILCQVSIRGRSLWGQESFLVAVFVQGIAGALQAWFFLKPANIVIAELQRIDSLGLTGKGEFNEEA